MVIVRHLVYLGLLTFTGADASWIYGRQRRGQDEVNVRDTLAQFFARSPQGPGGRGGGGGGRNGGSGGGGRGGGGGQGGGHGGPGGHRGPGIPIGPGGPDGPVGPAAPGGFGGGGGPVVDLPPFDPGEDFPPDFPPSPPGFTPRPLLTTTITVGSFGYTSTIFTTDAFGRLTRYVLVAVPTLFSPTLSFPTTTPASLQTITITSGSALLTSTSTTTDANGSPTSVVVSNVPTFAPLQTITQTSGSFPFTATSLTTDALGSPTYVVVVNVPTPATTSDLFPVTSTIFTSDAFGSPTSIVISSAPSPTLQTITVVGGSFPFTSTVATIDANGVPTSVVVVGVPTQTVQTITVTSGSIDFTETVLTTDVNGSPTQIVVVNESTQPSFPYQTITVSTDPVGYTSTVPTTDANGFPMSVVIINVPTSAVPTDVVTSDLGDFSSVVETTTDADGPTAVVVAPTPTSEVDIGLTSEIAIEPTPSDIIVEPTLSDIVIEPTPTSVEIPLQTITVTDGPSSFTSIEATTDVNGNPTSVVVVNIPPFSTTTISSDSIGFTVTVATTDANGLPTSIVVVDVPAPSGACSIDSVPAECLQAGVGADVSYYANSILFADAFGGADNDVLPDYYLGLNPLATGSSTDLSVSLVANPGGDSVTIPGAPPYYPDATANYAGFPYNPNNATLVWSGYFSPPLTGNYTICAQAGNEAAFYLGSDHAFSCGSTDAPIGAPTDLVGESAQPACLDVSLDAQYLYPIREVFGINGLPSFLSTNISLAGAFLPLDLTFALYPQNCLNPVPS